MLDTATIGGVDGQHAVPAPWMNRRGGQRHWWTGPAPVATRPQVHSVVFIFLLFFLFSIQFQLSTEFC
jgi:hypothetical protein